jgi:hypothetical protein
MGRVGEDAGDARGVRLSAAITMLARTDQNGRIVRAGCGLAMVSGMMPVSRCAGWCRPAVMR